ncbi:MAG: hypothetical protein AMJ84_12340 [Acidithiobacillales bacterium SM23_46]|jgi:septal ring factor EnvC (AmiA/AmiB activator)|nr:MAG: hypothetical protein AMJ84_12340 [Acidithiobacillales bacterium SM23_46]KPL28512.1 MAG: hypothetical protein AMJ72_02975 [Acidithiobacillales bacterium SM1_46]
MKSRFAVAMLAALWLAGLAGCSNKEVLELKARVTRLEQDLAASRADLSARDEALAEVSGHLAQTQAELKTQTEKLVRMKTERDKLKKDNNVLRKRCKL